MSDNKTADELWQHIYQNTHAPRETVVAYIKALSKEAETLPYEARIAQATNGWGRNNPRGDEIISSIIHALAMQDWLDDYAVDDLNEILEIAGQIELHTSNEELWEQLFMKTKALKPK